MGYNPELLSVAGTRKTATHLGEKTDTPCKHCKKAGVALLIFDKVDFKTKKTRGDKEGHSIMIIGLICQEDLTTYMHLTTELQKHTGARTDRIEKKNRKIQNYSWRLQHFSQ